jgi:hypothetical protein
MSFLSIFYKLFFSLQNNVSRGSRTAASHRMRKFPAMAKQNQVVSILRVLQTLRQ